jgi:hypothetical protein
MCGHGFQGLNQALMILLPKCSDATALCDYRPINLIHIFVKPVAKTMATRLPSDGGASGSQLMRVDERRLHTVGEPREEGMMSTATSFSSEIQI